MHRSGVYNRHSSGSSWLTQELRFLESLSLYGWFRLGPKEHLSKDRRRKRCRRARQPPASLTPHCSASPVFLRGDAWPRATYRWLHGGTLPASSPGRLGVASQRHSFHPGSPRPPLRTLSHIYVSSNSCHPVTPTAPLLPRANERTSEKKRQGGSHELQRSAVQPRRHQDT